MLKRILFLILSIAILANPIPSLAKNPRELTDKELANKIDTYIEERKEATPAVAIGVFKDGQVIYENHYGKIDIENNIDNSPQAIFEWASVSKSLVWISVLQLVEQGKLDLDANIQDYLDDDFPLKKSFEEPIKLINLMNHDAGFQEAIYQTEYDLGEEIPSLKESLVQTMPKQVNKPGQVTAYSNWGTALAGYIVENVTGIPFYEYVNENIFKVLGMNHTSIKPDWSDNPFVKKHRLETKSYILTQEDEESLGLAIAHIGLYPAGACSGSSQDYMKFVAEFTKEETELFKNKETWDYFKIASKNYSSTDIGRIYHGLWSLDYGEKVIGHAGNSKGFSSAFWFEPKSATAVSIMTNELGDLTYNYGILELIYGPHSDKHIEENKDISGVYFPSRTIFTGFGKYAKYFAGILPINKDSDKGFKVPIAESKIINCGKSFYRLEADNGLSYLKYLNGNKIESYTSDYEKFTSIEFGSLLIFALAMVLSIFVGPLSLIIMLVNKIKNKKTTSFSLAANLTLGLAMGLSLGFFIIVGEFEYFTKAFVVAIGLISLGLIAIITANFIYQFLGKLKNKNTIWDFLKSSLALLVGLAMIFFDMHKFWI